MGNAVAMQRRAERTDQHLRDLLRAGRKIAGNLSQEAAARRAGISPVYWQKIESGTQGHVPADTLAAMFWATGITSEHLKEKGYPEVAARCAELEAAAQPELTAEDYLAETPGATPDEISALQAVWKALRAKRTTAPDESDFRRTRRNSPP